MLYSQKLKVEECFALVKAKKLSKSVKHEERDINSIKIKGKTVIVLCGNNTKNPNRASAYTDYCFSWMKGVADQKDITAYAIYYPNSQPLRSDFTPNSAFDYEGLAKALFNQILYDKGKKVSPDEVADQMSDLVFFGHSMGGYVMNELLYQLGLMMKENKFSLKDMRKVYSRIVFIGYSPFELVEAPSKNIYITPIYDSLGSLRLAYGKLLKNKDFKSSIKNIDFHDLKNVEIDIYENFKSFYESLTEGRDIAFYKKDNSLVVVPNLMYYDGIKEDHNLAGVINYSSTNPYKTNAGELATKFMSQIFEYGVRTDRKRFSMEDVYKKSVGNFSLSAEQKQSE